MVCFPNVIDVLTVNVKCVEWCHFSHKPVLAPSTYCELTHRLGKDQKLFISFVTFAQSPISHSKTFHVIFHTTGAVTVCYE